MTKNGKLISMWPVSASSRSVIFSSMARNDSTEISRSPWRISTKRDMCVPLKLWGRLTYMLKFAMVCCSPRRAVLHPHRVADVLDAHAVDGQAARVGAPLHILDFRNDGAHDLGVAGRGRHVIEPESLPNIVGK